MLQTQQLRDMNIFPEEKLIKKKLVKKKLIEEKMIYETDCRRYAFVG